MMAGCGNIHKWLAILNRNLHLLVSSKRVGRKNNVCSEIKKASLLCKKPILYRNPCG
jgi:hypothetical protein